jgi:hypothetical protein
MQQRRYDERSEEFSCKSAGHSTNIPQALEYLNKVTSRKSIAFLISDFFLPGAVASSMADSREYRNDLKQKGEGLKKSLSIANKRHDVIAITLNDPREMQLPECGLIVLQDAESGQQVMVDSSNAVLRRQYHQDNINRIKQREKFFRAIGIDFIDISTDVPYADAIVKFFLKRRRRK